MSGTIDFTPDQSPCRCTDGAAPTNAALPCESSDDFDFDVACRFIKAGDGITRVKLCGTGLLGAGLLAPPGNYTWQAGGPNITLSQTTGLEVDVRAGASPSAGRETETITVTRTHDGNTTRKTLRLTVVRITFSGYDGTRRVGKYGYDDYVLPPNAPELANAQQLNAQQSNAQQPNVQQPNVQQPNVLPPNAPPNTDPYWHHVSVETNKETHVRVTIEGGALASDFAFKSDDDAICEAEVSRGFAGTGAFDLMLRGGRTDRAETMIRVLCRGDGGGRHTCALHGGGGAPPVCFALIQAHVYTRVVVEVIVLKARDSRRPGTALAHPAHDYTAQAVLDRFNEKTMEAVVEFQLAPFTSSRYPVDANQVFDVPFDVNGDGALTYDINRIDLNTGMPAGQGADFEALRQAFPANPNQQHVVIVRKMISNYYLAQAAAVGDQELIVQSSANGVFFKQGRQVDLPHETGLFFVGDPQPVEVTINGRQLQLTKLTLSGPLTHAHPVNTPLPFSAGGWSTTPIIVSENAGLIADLEWAIVHECGHTVFRFNDLLDSTTGMLATCVMHHQMGGMDQRIRHLPRLLYYNNAAGAKECQWEKIERPSLATSTTSGP